MKSKTIWYRLDPVDRLVLGASKAGQIFMFALMVAGFVDTGWVFVALFFAMGLPGGVVKGFTQETTTN
jgi:hypothetical protein